MTQGFHASHAFRTLQAVEMDPQAAASFAATFGDVVHVGSISDWLATSDVPAVDVIVGGPPCQGFSTLGKQDAEDERNEMWRHYAHTIRLAQPKFFVVENVATFLDSAQFTHFVDETQLGGSLKDYSLREAVLNAADFGAAQTRKRAVVIGHRRDIPFPGFPEPTHPRDSWVALKEVLVGLPERI